MQLFPKIRRMVLPIAIGIVFISITSSCNGSKKYGCPNHLFTPMLLK